MISQSEKEKANVRVRVLVRYETLFRLFEFGWGVR
jgi:hypothetical protein